MEVHLNTKKKSHCEGIKCHSKSCWNWFPRELVESLFMRIFKSNWIWPWVACIRSPCSSSDELYHKISRHFFQSKEFCDSVIKAQVRKSAGKGVRGCSLGRLDNCCRRHPTDILQSDKEVIKQKYQLRKRRNFFNVLEESSSSSRMGISKYRSK